MAGSVRCVRFQKSFADIGRPDVCATVEFAVAAAFAIPVGKLRAASRGNASIAFARQSAMYLAHVALGLSFTAVGRAFGRDRTTAAHACRLVEGRRDDPRLDATLGALEQVLISGRPIERAVRS